MAYGPLRSSYIYNGYNFQQGYGFVDVPPCLETQNPVPITGLAPVIGVGYQWPIIKTVISATHNPTEISANLLGGGATIAAQGPYDETTLARAWTAPEIGNQFLDIYVYNCFGSDYASDFVVVQAAGWTAGEPKLMLAGSVVYELGADPASVDLRNLFIWYEDVDSVVIKDQADNTTLYSGPIATTMINNTYYTCAKLGYRTLEVTATNGVGSMTLLTGPLFQDNLAVCP